MDPITSYIVAAYVVIFAHVGLGAHVLSRSPRRPVAWAFAGFLGAIALTYLTTFFLFPTDTIPAEPPLAMRLEWAAICLAIPFFFHFNQAYFHPEIRRRTSALLLVLYAISIFMAVACLFTPWFVAGVLDRGSTRILGIQPGNLIWVGLTAFMLSITGTVWGLLTSLRKLSSPLLRKQILMLLSPLGFVVFAAGLNIARVLAQSEILPFLLTDVLVIAGAFLYTVAVVQVGSFTGRVTAARQVFYMQLGTLLAILLLMLSLSLDIFIASRIGYPLPLITSLIITLYIATWPLLTHQLFTYLESIFEPREIRQAQIATGTSDPELLREELLGMLCQSVNSSGALVAEVVAAPFVPVLDLSPEYQSSNQTESAPSLQVQAIYGQLPLRPGQRLPLPSLVTSVPQPIITLSSTEQEIHTWYGLSAWCRLTSFAMPDFVLAVCNPGSDHLLNDAELKLMETYARQLEIAQQIVILDHKRQAALDTAQEQSANLQALETQIARLMNGVTTEHELLFGQSTQPNSAAQANVRITLLGLLQVQVNGQIIPESAWGSERARALLGYLLWKGRTGATSGELLEVLWPERGDDPSLNVLYVTINRLRNVLEPDLAHKRDSRYILAEGGRYRFNFDEPHWLDVTAFRTLAASARLDDIRQAAELYRGPYLEDVGWSLPPDIEVERRTLEQLYIQCLRRLVDTLQGKDDNLYLERLLAVEPLDEQANLQYGEQLLNRGRPEQAMESLSRYRAALEDLDETPSPAFRQLWRRVERAVQLRIP